MRYGGNVASGPRDEANRGARALASITVFRPLAKGARVLTVDYSRCVPATFEGWTFPRPPLPGVPSGIVPILTPAELVKEGDRQSNCVATFAKRVLEANVFVCRVLYPERASLSLVRCEDGCWRLGELKAALNMTVQPATRGIVDSWLARHTVD